jgi:hypothetical protein
MRSRYATATLTDLLRERKMLTFWAHSRNVLTLGHIFGMKIAHSSKRISQSRSYCIDCWHLDMCHYIFELTLYYLVNRFGSLDSHSSFYLAKLVTVKTRLNVDPCTLMLGTNHEFNMVSESYHAIVCHTNHTEYSSPSNCRLRFSSISWITLTNGACSCVRVHRRSKCLHMSVQLCILPRS